MKKTLLILFALFVGLNVFGQRTRTVEDRIPRGEPTEQEIEKRSRMIKERKEEYIDNFLTTLEGDDFQKEITRQHVNSFFDAKMAVMKTDFNHSLDRNAAVKKLEDTHFKDLEGLISEDDMAKIKEMITGGFDEGKAKKEKKKKRKKDKN